MASKGLVWWWKEQSPINIVTKHADFKNDLNPFHFIGYDAAYDVEIANNGHSAQVSLQNKGIQISEG
ncbi:unnamed protein product, partial [Staurois parvus]